jgi:dienelactone hydrolase
MYSTRLAVFNTTQLIIKDTASSVSLEIEGKSISNTKFSEDNKKAFLLKNNVFCIADLKTKTVDSISNVASVKYNAKDWIAIKLQSPDNTLVLYNAAEKKEKKIDNVVDYWFFDNEQSVLVKTRGGREDNVDEELGLVNLLDFTSRILFRTKNIGPIVFNNLDSQFAFLTNDNLKRSGKSVVAYYKKEIGKIAILSSETFLRNLDQDAILSEIEGFSIDGSKLFLELTNTHDGRSDFNPINVIVWNYLDPKLQSLQLTEAKMTNRFSYVLNLANNAILRLQYDNETIERKANDNWNDDYVLIRKLTGEVNECNWNTTAYHDSVFVVSTNGGVRRLVSSDSYKNRHHLLPSGKFVLYYDAIAKNYFSYEIATGIHRNISNDINGRWWQRNDEPSSERIAIGIAAFVNDDKVLVYDQNDIFLLDCYGKHSPTCVTNGYGKNHDIIFRLLMKAEDSILKTGDKLILSAFNRKNKQDGFYSIVINSKASLVMLTMEPYMFVGATEDAEFHSELPQKAKNVDVYLVHRSTADKSPNYFITRNFKTFSQITFNYPEKNFNWLTAQLINWKTFDGRNCQGILYKPENFDPKKKYPIIYTYYERNSNSLHGFPRPALSNGPLDFGTIAYLVSNNYIVCVPDIHYKIGQPGRSAYNAIVSVAKYFSSFSWIDTARMALHGHSFGGFETCYIIAHCQKFAAACASAPMTNFISAYGSIIRDGISRQKQYEYGRDRIGTNLWSGQNLYIENSPVLKADKVNTPLLMMANDKDDDVPWQQGLEFFTGLRRLGKRTWMLQYVNQGHMVLTEKKALDFTIRVKQFFDHYLKDSACPRWMLYGIDAKDKGRIDGFDLIKEKDPKTGKWLTPKEGGLLTDEEKKKVEALKHRKPVTVTIE